MRPLPDPPWVIKPGQTLVEMPRKTLFQAVKDLALLLFRGL